MFQSCVLALLVFLSVSSVYLRLLGARLYLNIASFMKGRKHVCMKIAKFNTSKMFRIPKLRKNVPVNNCHLKVIKNMSDLVI